MVANQLQQLFDSQHSKCFVGNACVTEVQDGSEISCFLGDQEVEGVQTAVGHPLPWPDLLS